MRITVTLILALILWVFAAPVLTGCGGKALSDSNASSVENGRSAVNDGISSDEETGSGYILMNMMKEATAEVLGENYWPDKQLTKQELETETGISEELYVEYLAEKQKVETDIDMMIIIKAKPERLTEIEDLLDVYRDSLLVKYKERPQELGKASASRIEIIDNFICFVQLGGDTSSAAQKGDEDVIAWCQQENEKAVAAIEETISDALLIENDQ